MSTEPLDPAGPALTELEADILDFEREWAGRVDHGAGQAPSWGNTAGAKQQEIRARFDLPEIRYLQLLNALLEQQAALAYDPHTVARLRRVRGRYLRTGRRQRRA